MLDTMPRKENTSGTGKKKPHRKGKALNVWIDAPLKDAMDKLAEEHHRPLNYEVELALQEYAAKHGALSPPQQD